MSIKPENLIVRREHLPERCEICHQSDQFDPVANRCSRCELVVIGPTPQTTRAPVTIFRFQRTTSTEEDSIILGIVLSFLCSGGILFLLYFLDDRFPHHHVTPVCFPGAGIILIFLSPVTGYFGGLYGQKLANRLHYRKNHPPSPGVDEAIILLCAVILCLGTCLLLISTCGLMEAH